jgi:formylglycine-generating enzyme required for sulfatase activity
MGSPPNEVDRDNNEGPQTAVMISGGFWMRKFEVTQGEYQAVMGSNPSYFNGDRSGPPDNDRDFGTDPSRPVEQVSWFDATKYCSKLTQQERAAGSIRTNSVYRLPTEAEWEYACRALTSDRRFYYGDDPDYTNLINYAWQGESFSSGGTHPVGQKVPNAWGLYDMAGNVFEWCQDRYGPYRGGSVIDPEGPAAGSTRVVRGGAWYGVDSVLRCRSAYRIDGDASHIESVLGFRVVLVPGLP